MSLLSAVSNIIQTGVLGEALISGALAAIPQEDRPVILLLLDGGIPSWLHWVVPRPEDMQYLHPTRATAINTLGGAYVDDFGSAIADISLRGNTGYKLGLIQEATKIVGLASGDVMLFNLRNAIVYNYHRKRKAYSDLGLDPEMVQLILADALNLTCWRVYPRQMQLQKSKQSPLLYRYILSLWGLERLL